MTTSTAIDLRVRSNIVTHVTHRADGHEALDCLPGEGAHAGRSTGTRLGGTRVSAFAELVEARIVRNELWLTLVEQRRNYMLATEMSPHLQERHLDQLDSWEDSIQRRLASAWVARHRASINPWRPVAQGQSADWLTRNVADYT